MIKVRLASFALAVFALSSVGSVVMADCGGDSCGGRQGIFAKLKAKKDAGCNGGASAGCNGGGLMAKIKAKRASKCGGAPTCCEPAPAPACCPAPAPAPACGCAAPAPKCCPAPAPACGCAAPAPACGCGVASTATVGTYVGTPTVVTSGCSSCGTTIDTGAVSTGSAVPPAPAAPAAAPASVSDKAPAA